MKKDKITIFWFRRDLRIVDNYSLFNALRSPHPVLPIFIFDTNITDELAKSDPRISFIFDLLLGLSNSLQKHDSNVLCRKGTPLSVWKKLISEYDVQAVFANEDYEPYAIGRDQEIDKLLSFHRIPFHLSKDQVIFEKGEILKKDGSPYTVYTPYKNKWLERFQDHGLKTFPSEKNFNYYRFQSSFPKLADLGFKRSSIKVQPNSLDRLDEYEKTRDFPAFNQTSFLGPHLRFGSVSIRKIVAEAIGHPTFLNELIWREFFMQILYHYPKVVAHNFRSKYDRLKWRNNEAEFEKWKSGQTGYPIVDAGMRQLNATGYMHNRVRMIVAGFLCKHLLVDWRWGEAYFAEKLLDYELSSNNGNWQWAAGTGCDAAPYFRVFNPSEQTKKFDPDLAYIRKWVKDFDSLSYPKPMVEHKFARERAISTYTSITSK